MSKTCVYEPPGFTSPEGSLPSISRTEMVFAVSLRHVIVSPVPAMSWWGTGPFAVTRTVPPAAIWSEAARGSGEEVTSRTRAGRDRSASPTAHPVTARRPLIAIDIVISRRLIGRHYPAEKCHPLIRKVLIR